MKQGFSGGGVFLAVLLVGSTAGAQDSVDDLVARGGELYNSDAGCWVCHAESGEGLMGPSLLGGPTPADIFDQLETNPIMGVIMQEMNPSDEDLVAISMYIRRLAGLEMTSALADDYRRALAAAKAGRPARLEFPKTERDLSVESIESFGSVLTDWQRKAAAGSLAGSYTSEVLATFDPGQPKFEPEPGHTYFYENLGNSPNLSVLKTGISSPASSQIVVGDAATKEVLASYELPPALRAAVHTTAVSPDGKFVYIVGPARSGAGGNPEIERTAPGNELRRSATMLIADALTLQPIKQVTIGGRLHHGQVFRDRYMLLDTFARDPDGLDVMLFDPTTDAIIGGVRDEELGGVSYTSFTDNEFIYILMEPGYASGQGGAPLLYQGKLVAMKPFWVVKLDPETWEVVREYPYPGYRGDWVVLDSASEFMYIISAGSSNIAKIDLETGAVDWAQATGIGPYGGSLNADESEIWIADKGEGAGHFGRTLSVLETSGGRIVSTVFSGYEVDHVLLAPNGKEMWATSNGEGRIYVFDASTHEQIAVIDMPQFGDPHGLVWVHYDDAGRARVVRDQGGFHNGVNPAAGVALSY
jgi:DNA-binding beta-propeller fold protein YncE/mono/diheme cytochrome c family protein